MNKLKLAACFIASSIAMTGCQKDIKDIFEKYRATSSEDKFKPIVVITPPTAHADEFDNTESNTIEVTLPNEETISVEVKIPPVPGVDPTDLPVIEVPATVVDPNNQQTLTKTETTEETQQPVDEEIKPEAYHEGYEIGYIAEETELKSSDSEVSPIITNLDINAQAIRIFSCDNGWDLIKSNEYIGYVRSNQIEYTQNRHFAGEDFIITKHNDIVVTTTTLNFRKQPHAEAEWIRTFNVDTELEVIATVSNGWLAVRYNGEIGFVHGGYTISMLEMARNIYPELNLEELEVQKIVYPNDELNIRCGNSIEFESFGLLEKYETVRVLGEYDDWYFVITNERDFGFICKEYTTTLEEKCIVVDKSSQQLYYYNDGELIYTTEVTTGKDETPSDTGSFKIQTKAMYVTLTDNETYWSDVVFWLRYNGGEGIHDADWRYLFNDPNARSWNTFGNESYHTNGSHGCINTPYEVVEMIYNEVELGDRVLVHK